jgi:hypothetical protein
MHNRLSVYIAPSELIAKLSDLKFRTRDAEKASKIILKFRISLCKSDGWSFERIVSNYKRSSQKAFETIPDKLLVCDNYYIMELTGRVQRSSQKRSFYYMDQPGVSTVEIPPQCEFSH